MSFHTAFALRLVILYLFVSITGIFNSAFSQDDFTAGTASHFGGWLAAVKAPPTGDGYIYLGQGTGMTVFDVSNKSKPFQVSSLQFAGSDVSAIEIIGNTLFLTNSTNLVSVDITDPLQPQVFDEMSLAEARQVHVANNKAYVAGGRQDALKIVDVSNPSALNLLGTFSISNTEAANIYVVDQTAYLGLRNGFQIVDVSNPGNPTLKGTSNVTGLSQVIGTTAYLANGQNGLIMMDVSNPAQITQIGSYDTPGSVFDVQVIGTKAYVADGDSGFIILNVANPTFPQKLGSVKDSFSCYIVSVSGNYANLGCGEDGLQVVDVSDAAHPQVVGSFECPTFPVDSWLDNGATIGYISEPGRFWVVDWSDPLIPVPIANAPLQAKSWPYETMRLFATSNLVYVAEDNPSCVEIVDVADSLNPQVIGLYQPPGGEVVKDVQVIASYAYVPTQGFTSWLHIVDISSPVNPVDIGSISFTGEVQRIAVGQNTACIAAGADGVRLFDVSDPAQPKEKTGIAAGGSKTHVVYIDGDNLYVGNTSGGNFSVQSFTITGPGQVAPLSAPFQDKGTLTDLDVEAGYVSCAVQGASFIWLSQVMNTLTRAGSYTTSMPSNINTFTTSSGGTFTTGTEKSYGHITVSIGDLRKCMIFGAISPKKAKNDGCIVTPASSPCACGSGVKFKADAKNGWVFGYWSPEPPHFCPPAGSSIVTGVFKPSLELGGSGNVELCASEENKNITVLTMTLTASNADDWKVSSFTFQASGNGKDDKDVTNVKLVGKGGTLGQGKYSGDDGTISFSFPEIFIPAGQSEVFNLIYDFMVMECTMQAKTFTASLLNHNADAVNFPPGVVMGGFASGQARAGCVHNVQLDEYYDTIQEAVDKADNDQVIEVCPGSYPEFVVVNKPLTIRSKQGFAVTTVVTPNPKKNVFEVKRTNTTIQGFTIGGATATDKAGIWVHGTGIKNISLLQNRPTGNYYGVLLDQVQQSTIQGNWIEQNKQIGLLQKGGSRNELTSNRFIDNFKYGLQIIDHKDEETKVTYSSVNAHSMGTGIRLDNCTHVLIDKNWEFTGNKTGVELVSCDSIKITITEEIKENDQGVVVNNSTNTLMVFQSPMMFELASLSMSTPLRLGA